MADANPYPRDFFRERFGSVAEKVASWMIVPSYFGWIATQLLALASVFYTLYGFPVEASIVVIAIVGTGYCLLGGMVSVSRIDVLQTLLIAIGLLLLTGTVVGEFSDASLLDSVRQWIAQVPADSLVADGPDGSGS